MISSFVRRLFGIGVENDPNRNISPPGRVTLTTPPAVCYCIGDVHGCLGLLRQMEEKIAADGAAYDGEKWIVLLGDMIDRGPSSAQVIDHVLAPPPAGFTRFCLSGNHERGLLEFVDRPDRNSWWLEHGGLETLASYDVDTTRLTGRSSATERRYLLVSHVPEEHLVFLRGLPALIETPDWIFVHAGLQPGVPLERQSDETMLWYRDDQRAGFGEWNKVVVHGHSPLDAVFVSPNRINVDTGAAQTGRLSAVRLVPGEAPVVLDVVGAPNGR